MESNPSEPATGSHLPAGGTPPAPGAVPTPGLWRRAALIFTRPSQAWAGLGDRAVWWFPLLVVAIVSTLTMLAVYDRAYLPMMTENVERQAADGRMTQSQLDRAEGFFGGPAGKAVNAGFQLAGVVIVTLLVALALWLGGAFILGKEKFEFRHALEVAAWSGLVSLPSAVLASVLAYAQNLPIREIHVGFGILVPEPDVPSGLTTFFRSFLDGLGPFSIWHVAVATFGLAALGRAAVREAALAVASLYVVLDLLGAGLAALTTRGG